MIPIFFISESSWNFKSLVRLLLSKIYYSRSTVPTSNKYPELVVIGECTLLGRAIIRYIGIVDGYNDASSLL